MVGLGALERGDQFQRARDAVEREVALDLEVLVVDRFHGGRLEGDLGVVLGVEEVGGAQVAVALGLARVDAGRVDGAVGVDAVGRHLERALELLELALDVRDAEVFDLEFDARVDRVELPRSCGERGLRCRALR